MTYLLPLNNLKMFEETKSGLSSICKMQNMGKRSYVLGVGIIRNR